MPALASVLFVAVLTFAAYAIGSNTPLNPRSQSASTGIISASAAPPAPPAPAVNDTADKYCIKPPDNRYVYRSDKPKNQAFAEGGKSYFNLFGRPCKGPALRGSSILVEAFCRKEDFCDATMEGSKCDTGKGLGSCELFNAQNPYKVAAGPAGSTSDGGGSAGQTLPKTETPPVQSTAPVTGQQQIKDAYTTTPKAPGAQVPATGGVQQAPVTQIEKIANSSQPVPAQTPTQLARETPPAPSVAGNTAGLAPGITPAKQPATGLRPTAPAQSGLPPTAQNTFPRPTFRPSGQSTGSNTGSRFSNFFSNFSIQSLFSGVTNLMTNVVAQSQPKQATVVQNTTVVRTQQPIVVPTTQVSQQNMQTPVIIPGQQRTSVQYPGNLGVPSSVPVEVSLGTSVSARDIGKAVRITIPEKDDLLNEDLLEDAGAESPREIVRATSTVTGSTPRVPTPVLFVNTASSTPENIRRVFIEKASSLSTVLESDFRPASTTQRSSALVEVFHAISISDLLDAITQGSMDLIRRVLARGEPEHPVVLTQYEEPEVSPVILGSAPTLPSGPGVQNSVRENDTDAGRAGSGTSAPSRAIEERERFEERISRDATVVFQDASPVHRNDDYVRPVRPSNIYPDVVPVPVRREAVSSAPSFLELVVKNSAVEIKKLFTTIWHIILPPRE